jgi:hypothetical protein
MRRVRVVSTPRNVGPARCSSPQGASCSSPAKTASRGAQPRRNSPRTRTSRSTRYESATSTANSTTRAAHGSGIARSTPTARSSSVQIASSAGARRAPPRIRWPISSRSPTTRTGTTFGGLGSRRRLIAASLVWWLWCWPSGPTPRRSWPPSRPVIRSTSGALVVGDTDVQGHVRRPDRDGARRGDQGHGLAAAVLDPPVPGPRPTPEAGHRLLARCPLARLAEKSLRLLWATALGTIP